ncbi:M23 family metallopeptidase [Calothrix sp. PCC 7507]|uniref:M23 family metallopeptidase n=1 Tax=Calothrix sp. PCC 7507 TaxID=99598 RepID=UPI00029F3797|nr:M23 family metallopeptidase [Calothrix sp. PCC 7507]AFY32070.1 Peptidase M23 [Calothrix sp. PCC 7507]
MTQRHNSAHNRLENLTTKRFASTLPAQSLCWLSSFSLLSGGFVFAQTETSIDNIVPTIENSQPSAATNPVKQNIVTPQVTQPQPEFAERQTRLRKRLNSKSVSPSPESVTQSKPQVETSSVAPSSIREEKPKQEPRSLPEKLPVVAQPANNSNSAAIRTGEKTKDYNNAYIDPTDYNPNAAGGYQAPNSVVITERSSGCQATLSAMQGTSPCTKTPASGNQRVAGAEGQAAPGWLRKSQNAQLATVPAVRRPVTTVNNGGWRGTRVASSGTTNRAYNPNRFIPQPSNFSPTQVSATPLAPSGGALSAPMAEGNVAPRASTVAYDFPLASTLPQIPYAGTVAYGGTGMMFPLSVPAPITSLFGWRVHPITGDRRFHAGTDLGAPMGTPVLAAARGQVESADWQGGYGLAVVIDHGSAQQSLYGHMSEIFVQPGQEVEAGTVIGRVGSTGNSTGPHLHFEVRHLTPDGWVATDPGVQLQTALSQLVQSLRTAQVAQQPGG